MVAGGVVVVFGSSVVVAKKECLTQFLKGVRICVGTYKEHICLCMIADIPQYQTVAHNPQVELLHRRHCISGSSVQESPPLVGL